MSCGKAWTAEEDARMLALLAQGKTQRAVGEMLGRPNTSIASRMALLRPNPIPRGGVKQRKCLCCNKPFHTQENYRLCRYCRAQSLSPYAI